MIEKLKPCPFCGSEAETYARTKNVPQDSLEVLDAMFIADCTVCNANIELEESQEAAIKAWNTRVGMHTELVEALRACIGVIVEYTEYEHSGDPWEEDARAMGEMSIDDFKQEGKLQDVIDLLLKATKQEG